MTCDNSKCGCRNRSEFNPCGELIPCNDYCPDGVPCAYAIVSACRWVRGCVFLNKITPLWKDCLFGNTWSARIFNEQHDVSTSCSPADSLIGPEDQRCPEYGLPTWDFVPPSGCPDECGHGGRIVQVSPPVCYEDSDYKASKLSFSCERMPNNYPPEPYRCGWSDWYDSAYTCSLGSSYWADQLAACTRIIWLLEITGVDTATLKVYGCENYGYGDETVLVATYECNSWKCLPEGSGEGDHGNTFTMQDYPNTDYGELPKYLCVVPYSSDWQTYCTPKSKACDCGDPGWSNFCLDLSGVTCGNLNITSATLTRHLSGGLTDQNGNDLSGYLSAPSPAPCGYFTGPTAGGATQCDGAGTYTWLWFVVWCDGTDWNIRIYCIKGVGTTTAVSAVSLICDTTFTVTEICPDGMRGTFDCGALDGGSDCCESCTVNLCGCDIATTLYLTLDKDDCSDIDGEVITLLYTGSGGTWSGTATLGDCGEVTFTAVLVEPVCAWKITVTDSDGNECSPEYTLTGDICTGIPNGTPYWYADRCPCCPDGTFQYNLSM